MSCGSASAPAGDAAGGNWAGPQDASQSPAAAEARADVPRASGGSCEADETVLFQCRLRRGRVAVCGGRSERGRPYARYLYAEGGRIELEYPAAGEREVSTMVRAQTGYSGGGEAQIHFSRDGHLYVVYSRVVRTGFGPDGHFNPAFEAGVAVKRGERWISDRRCVDPADADLDAPAAERFLPEGEFAAWWEGENELPPPR